jgi:hypothetical protein
MLLGAIINYIVELRMIKFSYTLYTHTHTHTHTHAV